MEEPCCKDNAIIRMATNNVKHKLSASSRSVINSGLTDDYRQAIAEYAWNGFDAEATIVDIRKRPF